MALFQSLKVTKGQIHLKNRIMLNNFGTEYGKDIIQVPVCSMK